MLSIASNIFEGVIMMKKFCGHCFKEVECTYNERIKEFEYDNNKFSFLEKYYVCDECHEEFYDDLNDYNVITANNEMRKFYGTITISEIEEIMEKYNIGKKPLSLILGLGEIISSLIIGSKLMEFSPLIVRYNKIGIKKTIKEYGVDEKEFLEKLDEMMIKKWLI